MVCLQNSLNLELVITFFIETRLYQSYQCSHRQRKIHYRKVFFFVLGLASAGTSNSPGAASDDVARNIGTCCVQHQVSICNIQVKHCNMCLFFGFLWDIFTIALPFLFSKEWEAGCLFCHVEFRKIIFEILYVPRKSSSLFHF